MDRYQLRIEASFLLKCTPQAAYDWLYEHRTTDETRRFTERNDVLEYLLVRRREPLIDLGIARFGNSKRAIRAVFRRGDPGVRCAALSNRLAGSGWALSGWLDVHQLHDLLRKGTNAELEALIKNEFVGNEFLEQLLERTELFTDIPEPRFRTFLEWLSSNPRMSKPYDERILDGWAEYSHNRIFGLAWDLARRLPAEPIYAGVLSALLSRTKVPIGFENAHEVIERWRIEAPREGGGPQYTPSYSLRSRLADVLEPDDSLLNSEDPALRRSFFHRFDPDDYKDWPTFIDKDGELAFNAMVHNDKIWRSATLRYWLREVAWIVPDPNSDMDAPNLYRAVEERYRKDHPEWFQSDHIEDGEILEVVDDGIPGWFEEKRRQRDVNLYGDVLDALEEPEGKPECPPHGESPASTVEHKLTTLLEHNVVATDTKERLREYLDDYRSGRLDYGDEQYIIALYARLLGNR